MKVYKNTEDLSLGERIKYLRKENNLLQEDVTSALGVCRSTCSHYERGFSIASISKSMKLAEVFHTSISYLLTGKPDKNVDKGKKKQFKKSKLFSLLFFIYEMKKLNKIGNFSEKYKVNTWKTEWRKQIEQARETTR